MLKPVFIAGLWRLSFLTAVLFLFSGAARFPTAGNAGRDILLADPSVFYYNGTYYLYGTGSPASNGFTVYTSTDLETWKGPAGAHEGYALQKGGAYGSNGFWAPQVFALNNRFYMAYTANEHIAIAVSDNPLGPFQQQNIQPLQADVKQIDPFVFIDSDDKKYLYYVVVGNGANRIYAAEMNDDLLSVKTGTEKLCIEASQPWENADTAYNKWPVTEGPTVVRQKSEYYLVYSANHFKSTRYAVGYAVSKSPLGPWKKCPGNPIISKEITGQNGSGHGDLVKGKKGEWYYVFHTHNAADKIAPRKTAIIKAAFVADKKTGADKLVIQPGSFRYLHANR
jgi:xylan 1,4-beta-xylosidase